MPCPATANSSTIAGASSRRAGRYRVLECMIIVSSKPTVAEAGLADCEPLHIEGKQPIRRIARFSSCHQGSNMFGRGRGKGIEVVSALQGGYHPACATFAGNLEQSFGRPAEIGILEIEVGQRIGAMGVEAG